MYRVKATHASIGFLIKNSSQMDVWGISGRVTDSVGRLIVSGLYSADILISYVIVLAELEKKVPSEEIQSTSK